MNITEKIAEKLKKIKIKDVMTRSVITTAPEETLSDLADLLIKTKISGLPVVDKAGQMVGIVTTTDLLRAMAQIKEGRFSGLLRTPLEGPAVADIMTKRVSTIREDQSLWDTVELMCGRNIHTIPVVKEGKLIGVVDRDDVMMYFYAAVRDSVEL